MNMNELDRQRLRDQFATAAIAPLMVDWYNSSESFEQIAEHAYDLADAMLAERGKR
jgi:hypothetical protein